jgi:uncharacterized protein (PEP-CTERM system associated)
MTPGKRGLAATMGCLGLIGFAAASHAQTVFAPRVGVDVTWTDNVELVGPGAGKRDELIGQVSPGFRLQRDTQRLQAFIDYELQALYFEESDGNEEIFHTGELGVNLEAIPEWLFLELGATHTQTVIDPTQPQNINNLFASGNTADATSARISPILRHAFGQVELEASYTQGLLDYDEVEDPDQSDFSLDDSENRNTSVALRSLDTEATVTWETSYNRDKVEYDLALPFDYERVNAELGFRVSPTLRLIARGGLESDPLQIVSDGGLDETTYAGGFSWRTGERNELRVLVGERFFGTSYDVLWRRVARALEMEVSYVELPTTQTQDRVFRGVDPNPAIPPDLGPGFSRTSADVYLLKRLAGSLALHGRVTDLFLLVTSEKREYLRLAGIEDDSRAASLRLDRRLGPRVLATLTGGISDNELREGDSYKQYDYSLTFARQVGSRTEVTLSGNRTERTGGFSEYDANWVELGIQMEFGPRGEGRGPGRSTNRGNASPAGNTNSRSNRPTAPRSR